MHASLLIIVPLFSNEIADTGQTSAQIPQWVHREAFTKAKAVRWFGVCF
jgi:hypothetical protein